MATGDLGRALKDGEYLVRQGEVGDCMYVIQSGWIEVIAETAGTEVSLARLGKGEMLGEMAVFERDVRSASARAVGEARVLTVDKRNFLRRVSEDPSLALRLMETMSHRIRELDQELSQLKASRSS
jgi:CRP/FNR family transcriptional regulator